MSTLPSASPRVRELALAVSASSLPAASPKRAALGSAGSPVLARVRAFESAMRQSAGLKERTEEPARSTRTRQRAAEEPPMFPSPRLDSPAKTPVKEVARKSQIGERLRRVSATLGVPVEQVVAEQEVLHASPLPSRRGPVIRKSPGANTG